MKILVLNGPNINMLGKREPDKYGNKTLEDINNNLVKISVELGCELSFFQSNNESEIVDEIQSSMGIYDGIIINPAAFTHTSISIRDALLAVSLPCVEVHLSNIYTREEFRQHSFIAPVCIGQISGFKEYSYEVGLRAIVNFLKSDAV